MLTMNLGFGREKTVAVVDVGDSGAGVAIITHTSGSPSTMLSEARSLLALEERDASHAATLTGDRVAEAASKALKLYAAAGRTAPIEQTYVFVHAPWTRTSTLQVSEKFPRDTKITDHLVSDFAKHALSEAKSLDRSRLFEASVIQVRLNGYATPEPVGKYARSLEVVSLLSECDPTVRSVVGKSVAEAFPVAKVLWRSGLRAAMTVASESLPRREYITLDIGNDSTSIASVRGDSIEQIDVPEGAHTILKRIAGGKPAEDVLATLRMMTRDACADETCEALSAAMSAAEPELVRIFGEVFAKMAAQSRIANELLLIVHPDLEPWMSRFFSRIDFGQFTITSLPFVVLTAASLDLSRWVAGSEHTDSLTLASALVNIESR